MASSKLHDSFFQEPAIRVHTDHGVDKTATASQLAMTDRDPETSSCITHSTHRSGVQAADIELSKDEQLAYSCNCQVSPAMGICWACEDSPSDDLALHSDSRSTVTDEDNIESLTPLLGIR